MPSQRKRIGFLPSKEVHEIIDELCKANEFSQSKVTGLLVEEALRSRGALSEYLTANARNKSKFINYSFEQQLSLNKKESVTDVEKYTINKKSFTEEIKMMHEFIEFKYFKKIMNQNKNIFQ